jgi:hypothetical protein
VFVRAGIKLELVQRHWDEGVRLVRDSELLLVSIVNLVEPQLLLPHGQLVLVVIKLELVQKPQDEGVRLAHDSELLLVLIVNLVEPQPYVTIASSSLVHLVLRLLM